MFKVKGLKSEKKIKRLLKTEKSHLNHPSYVVDLFPFLYNFFLSDFFFSYQPRFYFISFYFDVPWEVRVNLFYWSLRNVHWISFLFFLYMDKKLKKMYWINQWTCYYLEWIFVILRVNKVDYPYFIVVSMNHIDWDTTRTSSQ